MRSSPGKPDGSKKGVLIHVSLACPEIFADCTLPCNLQQIASTSEAHSPNKKSNENRNFFLSKYHNLSILGMTLLNCFYLFMYCKMKTRVNRGKIFIFSLEWARFTTVITGVTYVDCLTFAETLLMKSWPTHSEQYQKRYMQLLWPNPSGTVECCELATKNMFEGGSWKNRSIIVPCRHVSKRLGSGQELRTFH